VRPVGRCPYKSALCSWKMDIEGAEPLVMQGAEGLLATANPPV
jgi:hypothetical protein